MRHWMQILDSGQEIVVQVQIPRPRAQGDQRLRQTNQGKE